MSADELRKALAEAQATIRLLQNELAETNRGLVALTLELEESNKELEAFSYSVSHDLRAPLRAMGGYTRLVQEEYGQAIGEEGSRMLDTVLESVRDMDHLIDDLLAFSRVGHREVERQRLDVGAVARTVRDELLAAHPERRIEFEIADDLPPAVADRAMVHEVLRNLLGNAVKFTRTRNVARVRVTGMQTGDECAYSVADNGVGFDMQYSRHLFRVFQRLHRHEEFEGTGIGLALVGRIVQRHGGRVWAEAKPDEGATFFFSLPASETNGAEGAGAKIYGGCVG